MGAANNADSCFASTAKKNIISLSSVQKSQLITISNRNRKQFKIFYRVNLMEHQKLLTKCLLHNAPKFVPHAKML
jgi:hypothetical protein